MQSLADLTGPQLLSLISAVAVLSTLSGAVVGVVVERRRGMARLTLALAPSDPEFEPTETWVEPPVRRRAPVSLQLAGLVLGGALAVVGAFGAGAVLVWHVGAPEALLELGRSAAVDAVPVAADE